MLGLPVGLDERKITKVQGSNSQKQATLTYSTLNIKKDYLPETCYHANYNHGNDNYGMVVSTQGAGIS